MTIRFTCDKCGSVLKIKDELAGTEGKCPKCKTRFVVPQPGSEEATAAPSTPAKNSVATEHESPADQVAPAEHAAPVTVAAVANKTAPPADPRHVETPESAKEEAPARTSSPSPKSPAKSSSKQHGDSPEKAATKAPAKPAAKPADDDDFDPVSFLMDGPKAKPTFQSDDDGPEERSPMAGGKARSNSPPPGRGFSLDDDGSDDPLDEPPPPPTRKWGAKKEVSAAEMAERSMGGSKNAAKDLLARSMEESRVRASEMPEEAPRFSFDFVGMFRELGLKAGGTLAGIVVAVIGTYWLMTIMIGTKIKLPDLGYVSGTVTISGKPAPGIKVYFTPLSKDIQGNSEKKQRARDAVGVTDAEGQFTMYYLPEVEGAAAGPSRIWLEAIDPTVVIPVHYGMGSDHRIDVKVGSNPPQKIEI